MKCCIKYGVNFIGLLFLLTKFEIQKCGQILCAHKPYFLMPGHIRIPKDNGTEQRNYTVVLKLALITR